MREAVRDDRICPDDDEWKHPLPHPADIDEDVERSEEEEAPATAEQDPARLLFASRAA